MNTKRLRETRKVELVETHNIALSLDRLHNTPSASWERALYHALCMSYCPSYEQRRMIREALHLP